jgi:hypothetical protein
MGGTETVGFARCANAHLSRKKRGEDGAPGSVAKMGTRFRGGDGCGVI